MTTPSTTVVPFASLPSCATKCGPLYDANGACVPPVVAVSNEETYDTCFCNYNKLQPFLTGTSNVCDTAGCDSSGITSIRNWFTSFCNGKAAAATTSTASSSSTGTSNNSSSSGGGDWMSTHWKWVIMIVVIVVGIAGIWIGACIWRRKYLKKKDRMYELGKGLPSTMAVNTQGQLVGPGVERAGGQPGMFMASAVNTYGEKQKKERKKWNVSQRT